MVGKDDPENGSRKEKPAENEEAQADGAATPDAGAAQDRSSEAASPDVDAPEVEAEVVDENDGVMSGSAPDDAPIDVEARVADAEGADATVAAASPRGGGFFSPGSILLGLFALFGVGFILVKSMTGGGSSDVDDDATTVNDRIVSASQDPVAATEIQTPRDDKAEAPLADEAEQRIEEPSVAGSQETDASRTAPAEIDLSAPQMSAEEEANEALADNGALANEPGIAEVAEEAEAPTATDPRAAIESLRERAMATQSAEPNEPAQAADEEEAEAAQASAVGPQGVDVSIEEAEDEAASSLAPSASEEVAQEEVAQEEVAQEEVPSASEEVAQEDPGRSRPGRLRPGRRRPGRRHWRVDDGPILGRRRQ